MEDGKAPNLLVSRSTVTDKLIYSEEYWLNLAIYRDAFTTSSDFIISPHSASAGLYIATGGSFHGWKFFPILGKYVVQALEGTLSSELREKWAWDRPRPDPSSNADWPKWEMKELVGPGTVPKL